MREELYRQWKSDEQAPFAGWDYSYLEGRMVEESSPWNYVEIVRSLVRTSTSVLVAGETFDLIVNRHGGYNVGELHRLLQKHGQLFTQQVGGDSLSDLHRERLGKRPCFDFSRTFECSNNHSTW